MLVSSMRLMATAACNSTRFLGPALRDGIRVGRTRNCLFSASRGSSSLVESFVAELYQSAPLPATASPRSPPSAYTPPVIVPRGSRSKEVLSGANNDDQFNRRRRKNSSGSSSNNKNRQPGRGNKQSNAHWHAKVPVLLEQLIRDPKKANSSHTKKYMLNLISSQNVPWRTVHSCSSHLLQNFRSRLSSKEFNIIIRALTHARRLAHQRGIRLSKSVPDAFAVFEIMQQQPRKSAAPDLHTYHGLLSAVKVLAQTHKWAPSKRMQKRWRWSAQPPDPQDPYSVELSAMVVELLEQAEQLAWGTFAQQDELSSSASSRMTSQQQNDILVLYNNALDALAMCRAHETAIDVFNKFMRLGIPPDIFTFNAALKAMQWHHDKQIRVDRVTSVMNDMHSHGVMPNSQTFTNSLACCKEHASMAEYVFEHMRQYVPPTTITFTALLVAYAESGRYDKLEPVLAEMEMAHTPPDLATYRYLVRFCKRFGHLELALKSFNHFIASGVKDHKFDVSRTVMELLRDVYEDGLLLLVFRKLGSDARQRIEVAELAVEAFGRLDMWKEADELTAELQNVYKPTNNRSAQQKIAHWRRIIESR